MRIRTKILGGFMIIAAIAMTLGIIGLVSTLTLNRITTELHELQKDQQSISNVLNAHYLWKQRLTESVLSGSEFKGSLDPKKCALGEWLNSEYAKKIKDPEMLHLMNSLSNPHGFIHTGANSIVTLIQAGKLEEARVFLERIIFPKTDEVISFLINMQARYVGLVEAKDSESTEIADFMKVFNIGFIIIAALVCAFLAFYISGKISEPIVMITNYIKTEVDQKMFK